MTLREVVSNLLGKGYKVTYRVRKDGGILITSIDGNKFSGAKGNIAARSMLGLTLSDRRKAQLTKITRERSVHPRKIPIYTPEDLEKYRKRVMRKWRKAGLTGSISKRNLRRIIEDRGLKGAETYLIEMERHTENKAYYGAIEGLLARIQNDIDVVGDEIEISYLQAAYKIIEDNKEQFKQDWLFQIFDTLYNYEQGITSASDFYNNVYRLINN